MTESKAPKSPQEPAHPPATASTDAGPPARTLGRRHVVVGLSASVALLPLVGCSDDDSGGDSTGTGGSNLAGSSSDTGGTEGSGGSTSDTGGTESSGGTGGDSESGTGSCTEIPDETAGPYPDTMNMIDNTAFERSDVREDRTGTPLTLTLTVLDATDSCSPIVGHKVMIWHCDKDGIYSEYSNSTNAGSTTTTYLRGWQTTDDNGQVTFETIYPGWYTPRATHVHIQLYDSAGENLLKTTQIGFEDSLNEEVYAQTELYTKGQNSTTNDTDQVWGLSGGSGTDGGGYDYQIATVTGDLDSGLSASIDVPV